MPQIPEEEQSQAEASDIVQNDGSIKDQDPVAASTHSNKIEETE